VALTTTGNDGDSASGGGGPQGPARARPRTNIEVVIPTFNEEINLPHSLRSVAGWADAVHVVDSVSTDRTREIAAEFGANVVVQAWLGYAAQKNWALTNLPLRADWVFILDADESITEELRDELCAIAARPTNDVVPTGFYVNRLTYFMGRPIRHCGYYPSYNLRFFKRGRAHYEDREVHEHMSVDGPTARLRRIMLHEDRRGLEHFIAKHNRYSTLEARELIREQMRARSTPSPKELERGIAVRRWLKKHVLPRLPLAGVWRFLYMYVLRLGFLDGAAGFRFSLLLSTYDFFISLKLHELRQLQRQGDSNALSKAVPTGLAKPEGTIGTATDAPIGVASRAQAATANATRTLPARAKAGGHADGDFVRALSKTGHWALTHEDAPSCPKPPVSVIVLSFNEEDNIGPCLESCAWCDDVHVLDSGSSDRTREIAEKMGAKVHVNAFKSFGQQRNWAIDNIPVKHRWQFQLDADERFTPAMVNEMAERLGENGDSIDGASAYQNPSMMMFMDRWLRHSAEYPVYQVRLLDKTLCRFEDYGHGQREVNRGKTGVMVQPYLHYNFSKGVDEWLEKHNRYSKLEAGQALERAQLSFGDMVRGVLFEGTVQRRRVLKVLSYRIPFRPTAIMLYQMVVRLGFLDGKAGLNYVRMRAIYEAMIGVKMSVLKHERTIADERRRGGTG
jgi:glycosyltransferase involved in cell wall biosynthesis